MPRHTIFCWILSNLWLSVENLRNRRNLNSTRPICYGLELLTSIPPAPLLNNNLIPTRMPYPSEEEALNNANYTQASNNTDGNSINVPVWWDE